MKTTRIAGSVTLLLAVACGGGAKTPHGPVPDFGVPFTAAVREEATGDQTKARAAYADSIASAVHYGDDPHALAALLASLDALVERSVMPLARASGDGALIYRGPKDDKTLASLAKSYDDADDPFSKGLLARSLEELASRRGDDKEAARWSAARGCATEAVVTGPLDWASITGVAEADPLAAFDAPVAASYRSPGPFGAPLATALVRDRGCDLQLTAASPQSGVRDVIVDVDVPEAQEIGVALRAGSAAVLRVGGKLAVDRPYALGDAEVARFARVKVGAGRVRLVARVGTEDASGTVEIAAWDTHGKPLRFHAPAAGEKGAVAAVDAHPFVMPTPKTDADRILVAAASLAIGDGHAAEQVLADVQKRDDAPPELLLVYARALGTATDLPTVQRAERTRAVVDRLLDKWPASWETVLIHAETAGDRKGASESRIEALKDLDDHKAKVTPANAFLLDAYDAAVSGQESLHDRAREAYDRATKAAGGAPLLDAVARVAFGRSQADDVAFECGSAPGHRKDDLLCYDALKTSGKRADATKELERVRGLRGEKLGFLVLEVRDALGVGDLAAAKRAYGSMVPGERNLATFASLQDEAMSPKDRRAQLVALASTSRDAPSALPSLFRVLGDDPAVEFEGVAARLAADDRAKPKLAQAATVLLAHTERYDVGSDGLVRYVLFDVRRVSGTTDVEENAAAAPPDLTGRYVVRTLRRRIHKKDGRILEPDRTPNASQGHADLAQLEQGDVVEALYEGFALPTETGDLGIDTPDLLPDRTAIVRADVELRIPKAVHSALWIHPLMGKMVETTEGDRRILKWSLTDRGTRRLEDGVPKMDRSVGFTYGTAEWATVARALRETLASLEDHDPEVSAWAKLAGAGKAPRSRELVDAIVGKVGDAVREASSAMLSDVNIGSGDGTTARTILATHEGSRTWLVVRSLRELGVPVDVVIAENEPYSADPTFPARFGRFSHPLAVAHVTSAKDPAQTEDVWIDSDVSGPPLPAGRISPELRGRTILKTDGTMASLPAASGNEERDEVDLRLVVDDNGDAKGSLTVLLRGRAAQQIAEALYRIVGVERDKALRGIALGWVPFANVESVALSSTEGSWQIAVRADITVPGYAQPEGQKSRTWVLPGIDPVHNVYPRSQVGTLGASYASQGARENALAISRAVQYHVHRRVELPKGASVLRSPGPVDVRSSNLEAQRKLTVDGTAIEEEFSLLVTTGTIAADKYGAFVADAHKVDDGFLASTRVKPPAAAK